MFLGFTGTAWNVDRETAMMPGDVYHMGEYALRYEGSRMCPGNPKCSAVEQSDIEKRMLFADIDVTRAGKSLGRMSPAKFIYSSQPDSPTTEIALRRGFREDLYLVVGTMDPQTKRATFQFHVNPLVSWIWTGLLILMTGAILSLFPELSFAEVGAWGYLRAAAGVAAGTAFALWIAMAPSMAYASQRSPRGPPDVALSAQSGRAQRKLPLPDFGGAALLGVAAGVLLIRVRRQPTDDARRAR